MYDLDSQTADKDTISCTAFQYDTSQWTTTLETEVSRTFLLTLFCMLLFEYQIITKK